LSKRALNYKLICLKARAEMIYDDMIERDDARTQCAALLSDAFERAHDASALSFIEFKLREVVRALNEREQCARVNEAFYARIHAQRMLSRK
jgi:hypothetical protein